MGEGGPGYKNQSEFNDHPARTRRISMAPRTDPARPVHNFSSVWCRLPLLDHQYTTFGNWSKANDVLAKIGDTPVTRKQAWRKQQTNDASRY